MLQAGLEFFNNCVFELKWKPQEDATSSDEEPPKKEEEKQEQSDRPSHDEVNMLREIVINFDLPDREWLHLLLVQHRAAFLKWVSSQAKPEFAEDIKAKLASGGEGLEQLLALEFEGGAALLDGAEED